MRRLLPDHFLLLPFFVTLYCATATAQNTNADTLDVVNWNIEYFASGNPHDPTLQVRDVRQIMNALNADIYAVCEVVNVDSFRHLAASLNGGYGALVAPFGSFAADTVSSGYPSAQKLGFIYRTSMVRNITSRALLSGSSTAYYNFSSGRFPFLVKAEVLGRDGRWRAITFIILHAKADSDATSCSRRIAGCAELKDTLDRSFLQTSFLLLGDYNDDLDVSICSGATQSNYAPLVADSAHYHALTLPISKAGAFSIDGYSSLIDHVIASGAMNRYYIAGSAQSLRTFVKGLITYYDNDVSDHFPIRTRYLLDSPRETAVPQVAPREITVYPQPASESITVQSSLPIVSDELWSLNGQRCIAHHPRNLTDVLPVHTLSPGIYLLKLTTADGAGMVRLISVARP